MTVLSAQNCSLSLRGRDLLTAVTVALPAGQVVGILGPNGAGKSTLLKALAGLTEGLSATNGVSGTGISLQGRPLETYTSEERARKIAYLPQSAPTAWPLRCWDVVALGRMPYKERPYQNRHLVEEVLAETDTLAFAQRPLTTLSGGERARVLLARALAVRAPVLLADEPVAHLDPAHQIQVLTLLQSRAQCGDAVAVVLHDLTLAARFCDTVVVIDGGRIKAVGPPGLVLTADLLATVFSISAIQGNHYGQPFILPWERVIP